jgi:hypothetical protein
LPLSPRTTIVKHRDGCHGRSLLPFFTYAYCHEIFRLPLSPRTTIVKHRAGCLAALYFLFLRMRTAMIFQVAAEPSHHHRQTSCRLSGRALFPFPGWIRSRSVQPPGQHQVREMHTIQNICTPVFQNQEIFMLEFRLFSIKRKTKYPENNSTIIG